MEWNLQGTVCLPMSETQIIAQLLLKFETSLID